MLFAFYIILLFLAMSLLIYLYNKCIYALFYDKKSNDSKSKACTFYIYKKDKIAILKVDDKYINFTPHLMNYSLYTNKSIINRPYYGFITKENDIDTIVVKYKRTNRLAFKILLRDNPSISLFNNISIMNVIVIDNKE